MFLLLFIFTKVSSAKHIQCRSILSYFKVSLQIIDITILDMLLNYLQDLHKMENDLLWNVS